MIYRKKNLLAALAIPVLLLVAGCGAKTIETTEIIEKTNVIHNVNVEETEGNTIVAIEAEFPINYTAFKLTDPVRIVVDINESDAGDVESSIPVFNDTVKDILVTQFDEDDSKVTRIEVVLNEIREYNIEKEQNKLYVTVNNVITEEISQEEVVEADELAEAQVPVVVEEEAVPAILASDIAAIMASDVEVEAPETSKIIESEAVEVSQNKAKYIADLAVNEVEDGARVVITGDGYLGDYNSFTLENPARIVVDIIDVKNLFRKNQVNATGVSLKKVRVGQHADKVRLVLDLPAGQSEQHSITRSGKTLIVSLGAAMADDVMAGYTPPMFEAEEVVEQEERPVVEPVVVASAAEGRITGINFRQLPQASRVIISSTNMVKYSLNEIGEGNVAIDISAVEIPKGLQRSLDTSDFDSPVSLVSAYQLKEGAENIVRVIVALSKEAAYDVKQEDGNIFVDFVREPSAESVSEIYAEIEDETSRTTGEMAMDEGENLKSVEVESGPAQIGDTMVVVGQDFKVGKKYTGRRISLDYKDADLHNLLRLFGEIHGLNVIIDEDVKGKVTLRLSDVPSDQALDIVLKSKGLGREQ
jgi:type IV pilus assembly protein PilQ